MIQNKSINQLAKIIRGVSYKPEDLSDEATDNYVPILRAMNISDGYLDFEGLVYINPKRVSETQKLIKGDIVIAASTGSKKVIGKAAQINNEWNGSFGAFCMVLRPQKDLVDAKYFGYYFQSDYYRKMISHMSSGANINNLKREYFDRLRIPLPELTNQQQIAEILDQLDSLRKKRKQVTELLNDYIKSVFIELFGDPVINTKNWPLAKFKDVGTLDRGKSKHRPRNAPELLGGIYPLIQTGDVSNSEGYIKQYTHTYSEFGLKQSKLWPIGTLCITIAANIAKTGILTFEACFPDSVVGFTPNNKVRTEYVQSWLGFLQKILEDNAPEAAQKNINLEILRNLNIPLPPIELQDKFVTVIKETLSLKQKMLEQSKEIDNQFQAVMQKSFQQRSYEN